MTKRFWRTAVLAAIAAGTVFGAVPAAAATADDGGSAGGAVRTAPAASTPASMVAAAPLPVPAGSAPAAVKYFGQLVVVRTVDNRLFYTFGNASGTAWTPAGWQEIPGGGRTPFAPAVVKAGDGRIYVAVVGMGGNGMFTQSVVIGPNPTSVPQWEGAWHQMPGGGAFLAGPEIVGVGGGYTFTVLAPGLSGAVHYQSWSQYTGYSGSWPYIPGTTTTREVGAAWVHTTPGTFAGNLVVVARGADRRLRYTWGGPGSGPVWWNPWAEIPGGGLSDHAPDMDGTIAGVATVVVRGIGDGVWYQTLVNGVWHTGWKLFTHSGNTGFAPAIAASTDTADVFVIGLNTAVYHQNLFVGLTNSGTDYRTWIPGIPAGWRVVPHSLAPGPIPQKPDLRFTGSPLWNAAEERYEIDFTNSGTVAAGPFRASIQINNSVLTDVVFNGLAVGGGGFLWFKPYQLGLPGGTHQYNLVLDVYNTVNESDEGNNNFHGYFTI